LGDILLDGRTAKGWTQRQVAERLTSPDGKAPEGPVINKYEKNRQIPSADRVGELIAVLDLDEARTWRAYLNARLKPDLLKALAQRSSAWSPEG